MLTSIMLNFYMTLLMVRHQGPLDYNLFGFEFILLIHLAFFAAIPIKKNTKDAIVGAQNDLKSHVMSSSLRISLLDNK